MGSHFSLTPLAETACSNKQETQQLVSEGGATVVLPQTGRHSVRRLGAANLATKL